MKFYISTFYQIRFFTENMLPVSTAMWDPKWYHNFGHQNVCFYDKRNILCGCRYEKFNLPASLWTDLVEQQEECQRDCPFREQVPECPFMKKYKQYLDSLDFEYIINEIEEMSSKVSKIDTIVLLVHESPKCLCAERPVLRQWFQDHGRELEEWIFIPER